MGRTREMQNNSEDDCLAGDSVNWFDTAGAGGQSRAGR